MSVLKPILIDARPIIPQRTSLGFPIMGDVTALATRMMLREHHELVGIFGQDNVAVRVIVDNEIEVPGKVYSSEKGIAQVERLGILDFMSKAPSHLSIIIPSESPLSLVSMIAWSLAGPFPFRNVQYKEAVSAENHCGELFKDIYHVTVLDWMKQRVVSHGPASESVFPI